MKRLALLVVALAFPNLATGAIIDFESLASNGTNVIYLGTTYTEGGFELLSLNNSHEVAPAFYSAESNYPLYYPGSAALYKWDQGFIQLTNLEGREFDLKSIDLSEVDRTRLGPTSVTFTGFRSGIAAASETFALDGIFGFETFTFQSDFVGLTSVEWTQIPQYHHFDNIVLNENAPVPEPTTLAVWSLLGLIGIGYGWRRRKR